jgi:hypothetical protein
MKLKFKWYLHENYTRHELEEVLAECTELEQITLKEFKELVEAMHRKEYSLILEYDTASEELKVLGEDDV